MYYANNGRTLLRAWKSILRCSSLKFHERALQSEVILTEINSCGVISLNRPKALNSLNLNMIRRIYPKLTEWNLSNKISHVIIEGTGDKAFCAGGDIKAVIDAAKIGKLDAHDFFREEYCLNHLIGTMQKPYIALLNGITMGGGVGLSVHGSHRICSEKCVFSMPETAIGLFPDVGGGYFLSKLTGELGVYLALVGHRLKGADILHAGIATHFVPSLKMEQLKEELCHASQLPPDRLVGILENFTTPITELPKFSLEDCLHSINKHFAYDTVEEIIDSLKQAPSEEREWCYKQLDVLQGMSPTSMKVTLRQLRTSGRQNMTLAEDLRMEYRISHRCVREGHDFFEGVRAILIDKDRKPIWNPKELCDVSEAFVEEFFQPLQHPDREWKPSEVFE